jgi:hypothetical protein
VGEGEFGGEATYGCVGASMMFLCRDVVRVLRGVLDLLLRGLFLGDLVGGRHYGVEMDYLDT